MSNQSDWLGSKSTPELRTFVSVYRIYIRFDFFLKSTSLPFPSNLTLSLYSFKKKQAPQLSHSSPCKISSLSPECGKRGSPTKSSMVMQPRLQMSSALRRWCWIFSAPPKGRCQRFCERKNTGKRQGKKIYFWSRAKRRRLHLCIRSMSETQRVKHHWIKTKTPHYQLQPDIPYIPNQVAFAFSLALGLRGHSNSPPLASSCCSAAHWEAQEHLFWFGEAKNLRSAPKAWKHH